MCLESSKGIGKAITLKFARKGHKLVLNARDKRELSEALNDVRICLEGSKERLTYLAGDISGKRLHISNRSYN
jgi:short-subunit dehydrogenase